MPDAYLAFDATVSSLFRFLLDALEPLFPRPVESAGLSSFLKRFEKLVLK